jgi:hypothetical protein
MMDERENSKMGGDVLNLEDGKSQSVIRRRPQRGAATIDPGSRIRSLKCFDEVDRQIRSGVYIRQVARYIQLEAKELTDMSIDAVGFLVKQHRDWVEKETTEVDREREHQGQPGVDEDDPFYELRALQRKFRDMEERIDMEVKTERSLKKLFSTTHKEFLTLAQLGKMILSRKAALGELDTERGGKQQHIGSGQPGRIDMARVVEDPESRHKVLGFFEMMTDDPGFIEEILQEREGPKKKRRRRRKKKKAVQEGGQAGQKKVIKVKKKRRLKKDSE